MKVGTLLSKKGRSVITVRPDSLISEISRILAQNRIGAIVVMGEGGKISGIVSERDIVRAMAANGAKILDEAVSTIMSRDVITATEESSVHEVMRIMTERRIRHLPILEAGAMVGIISISDVTNSHVENVEREATAMRSYFSTT